MKPVFITVVDLKPLLGCEIDPKEYNGVSVRCYISANNEAEARKQFSDALIQNKFELMEEDFFVQEDLVEWENPGSTEASDARSEARNSGKVVFSDFNGWGHDDPDAY